MQLSREQVAIGRVLLAEGPLTTDYVDEQIRKLGEDAPILAKAVKACGHCNEAALIATLLASYRIPRVRLASYDVPDDAVALLSTEDARRFRVVPIGRVGSITCLAIDNVFDMAVGVVYQIRRLLGGPVKFFQATPDELERALDKYYPLPRRELVKAAKVTPEEVEKARLEMVPAEHTRSGWERIHTSAGPLKATHVGS